jgi:hypothetical protein
MILAAAILACGAHSCTEIDYSHRVRAPSTIVKYVYVQNPDRVCKRVMHINGLELIFTKFFACTIYPDSSSMSDPNPAHFRRAIVYLPLEEKLHPTELTRHEKAHVNGFNHK